MKASITNPSARLTVAEVGSDRQAEDLAMDRFRDRQAAASEMESPIRLLQMRRDGIMDQRCDARLREVSPQAIATVAGRAAAEVPGIAGIADKHLRFGAAELQPADRYARGWRPSHLLGACPIPRR